MRDSHTAIGGENLESPYVLNCAILQSTKVNGTVLTCRLRITAGKRGIRITLAVWGSELDVSAGQCQMWALMIASPISAVIRGGVGRCRIAWWFTDPRSCRVHGKSKSLRADSCAVGNCGGAGAKLKRGYAGDAVNGPQLLSTDPFYAGDSLASRWTSGPVGISPLACGQTAVPGKQCGWRDEAVSADLAW